MLSFLFLVLAVRAENDPYVTLELEQAMPRVASRPLLTSIIIGRPERRYQLLVDFERNDIELRGCLHTSSFTFDSTAFDNRTTDFVMFDDDSLLDPVKRGVYRMPVREHCAGDDSPPFDSPACSAVDSCTGVLGLGPLSPLWIKWSSLTITKTALHFGSDHPLQQQQREIDATSIQCSGSTSEKLCEFSAVLAGRRVLVDFHADDSYIYAPAQIYRYYTEERNLYGFTSAQRRSISLRNAERHRLVAESAVRDNDDSKALFVERLEKDRQFATQYSVYYRGTHEYTDRADWPPLVLLPISSPSFVKNVAVIDYDLLVFSPAQSSSFGRYARLSAESPQLGNSARSVLTLMLRPQLNTSSSSSSLTSVQRLSLGNAFFRRYNVHKNVATNSIQIVERFATENLADVEALAMLYFFGYYIFSVCRMMFYSANLTVTLNRRCPVCIAPVDPYTPHRQPITLLAALGVGADLLLLVGVGWMLQHVSVFLTDVSTSDDATRFLDWSLVLMAPNFIVLLAMRATAPGHAAAADGTFCWRTFRSTVAYAGCSEHVALLGLLWGTIILRTDTLGTTLSAIAAAALFFSATHHMAHVYIFEHGLATRLFRFAQRNIVAAATASSSFLDDKNKETERGVHRFIFPNESANFGWTAFVLLLLLGVNVILTSIVLLRFIVLPALRSAAPAALLYAVALLLAVSLLEIYQKIAIRRNKFVAPLY